MGNWATPDVPQQRAGGGRRVVSSLLSTVFGEDSNIVHDRAFQVLLLVNLGPPLGTVLLSPLLDTLTQPYGVSEATVGLMITVYSAPSIVLIPIVGVLSDRIGRKPVLLWGLVLFGLGGTGLTFTSDFRVALALRLVQGIGFAGLTPIIITSLGDLYAGGREATAQGIRFASSGLALMVFPPLAGLLVVVAWNAPFLLYALPFPVALFAWRYLDEPSSPQERNDVAEGHTRVLLGGLAKPRIASVLVGRAVPNFVYTAFFTYNSFIVVRAVDGTPGQAGILVATASVSQAVAATQAGRLTTLFDTRFWPLVGAHLLMGIGLGAVGLGPGLPVLLLGGSCLGIGVGVSMSLYQSVITGFSPTLRGGFVSIGSSFGRIAATATPLVIGLIVTTFRPTHGFVTTVRWTIAGVGLGCILVGITCLAIAKMSPPIHLTVDEQSGETNGA